MVRRPCALLCLLLATGVAGAAAQPKAAAVRAYERAARELEFARFGEAVKVFEEAIALDPVESRQPVARPSGMNFEPYLPHLALGVARCESGDLSGALASWAESDRQAAARASRGAARLLQRREECTDRHRESLRAAEGERALSTLPAVDVEPGAPTPIVSRQPEENSLSVTPPAATEVEPRAPLAAPVLPAVSDSPPGELLRAAQELFEGRPARAYEILENFASDRSRARGQAHLLRAAACFDLARLEPDSAAAWLARAREERATARRSNPTLTPDRRYFAPGFVEFYARGADPPPLPDLLAR